MPRNQPQVVTLAEDEVCLGVQGGANLPETTVTAATFKAVLVPKHIQRLEQRNEPQATELPWVKKINIFTI